MWVSGGAKAGAIVEEMSRPAELRRRVPRVFDRWTVVGVDAPDRVLAEQFQGVGVADVGRIQERGSADRIAGDLNERAKIVGEPAGDETGDLLGDKVVVGVQTRRRRRVLRRFGVGEAGHVKGGDRRSLPVSALQRVAADLEPPAERRQFGKGGVTGGAGLPGLTGVGRQRLRRVRAESERRGRAREQRQRVLDARDARLDLRRTDRSAAHRRCAHQSLPRSLIASIPLTRERPEEGSDQVVD